MAKKSGLTVFLAFIVSIIAAHAFAATDVVDVFESYADGTVMDTGGNGWSVIYSNANPNSPIVKSAATDIYPEIDGQYWKLIDNGNTNDSELLIKNLPTTLTNDGDYLQAAVYVSSEQALSGINPSGAFEVRLRDEDGLTVLVMGIYQNRSSFYISTDYEITYIGAPENARPDNDTWYFLRATMRDANTDGILDSYDFTLFETDMTVKASVTGISTVFGSAAKVRC